jgi:hypothetical protein
VYAREVAGRELTFGVSGKLIMNALVMYDRETETLWSQFLGQAVEGELVGETLGVVSSQLLLWSTWKEEHPDTLVLDTGGGVFDQYNSYYVAPNSGVIGQSNYDERLIGKQLVVGLVGDEGARAYAHSDMAKVGILNDTFEGLDIVVGFDRSKGTTAIFDRTLDGELLTFTEGPESREMTDDQTGSVWSKLSGIAVSGSMEGRRLKPVLFFNSFWFAWSDFYPNTEVFEP